MIMRKCLILLLVILVLPASARFKRNQPGMKPDIAEVVQLRDVPEVSALGLDDLHLGDWLEGLDIGRLNIGKLLSLTKFYGNLKDDRSLSRTVEKFVKALKTRNSKKIDKAGRKLKKKMTKSCHRYFKQLAKEGWRAEKNHDYKTARRKYETISEMYDALSVFLPDLRNKYQDRLAGMKGGAL